MDAAVARAVEEFQRGGDREASFRLLVERFHGPVLSFFSRRVASPEDRRDLAQETFLRAFRGLEGFRGDSRFSTWLFRIAHHTYLGWARRDPGGREEPLEDRHGRPLPLGRDAVAPGGELSSPPLPADVAVLRSEGRRRLREAIDRLPDQMRRCMVLRVIHGMGYQEIADALRVSTGTVKAHLFKGRARLAAELGEEDDDLDV